MSRLGTGGWGLQAGKSSTDFERPPAAGALSELAICIRVGFEEWTAACEAFLPPASRLQPPVGGARSAAP